MSSSYFIKGVVILIILFRCFFFFKEYFICKIKFYSFFGIELRFWIYKMRNFGFGKFSFKFIGIDNGFFNFVKYFNDFGYIFCFILCECLRIMNYYYGNWIYGNCCFCYGNDIGSICS